MAKRKKRIEGGYAVVSDRESYCVVCRSIITPATGFAFSPSEEAANRGEYVFVCRDRDACDKAEEAYHVGAVAFSKYLRENEDNIKESVDKSASGIDHLDTLLRQIRNAHLN